MRKQLSLDEVKVSLAGFASELCTIPDDFAIHNDYSGELSKQDFIAAFKAYQSIIKRYYEKAANTPMDYGISHISRKTGEEVLNSALTSPLFQREREAQVLFFLLKLCRTSDLSDHTLVVDLVAFREAINTNGKILKPDVIIKRLMDEGFVFEGYQKSLKKTESLVLKHPQNPHVITVIKNYSESRYIHTGTMYDYAHFNYRLLTIGKEEVLPLEDLYVYRSLNKKSQEFVSAFNALMNKNNYFYGGNAIAGICWGQSQFAYSKDPLKKKDYVSRLYQRGDTLVVRLFLNKLDCYAHYIEKAPVYIKEGFINVQGQCNHCKGDQCRFRKTYSIDGKKYEKCNGEVFYFDCLEPKAIPYYVDLIKLSKSKGKSATYIDEANDVPAL